MLRRSSMVFALVVALVAHGAPMTSAQPATPELVALRVELSTDSDWTTLHLADVDVRVRRTVSMTAGDRLWDQGDGWTVARDGPSDVQAVFDVVVAFQPGVPLRIVVAKGRAGTATVRIRPRAGAAAIAEVVLPPDDPSGNQIEQTVDLATAVAPLAVDPIDPRNLTLAFYYPWFRSGAASDRRISPDKPAAPYGTDDATAVRSMVTDAEGAGIDGFIVSWGHDGVTQHAGALRLLAQEADQRPDFHVTPLAELRTFTRSTLLGTQPDPAAAADAVRAFLAISGPMSVLRVGDRPVVVVFGMWGYDASDWQLFHDRLADLDPFVIGDRIDPGLPVDGYYLYDPNAYSADELGPVYDQAVDRTRLDAVVDPDGHQRLWAATVSPGLDTRQALLLGRYRDRADGRRYDQTWDVALSRDPEWVFVTSWNEWYEQTQISPGSTTGRQALDQTAEWDARFSTTG